LSLFLGGLPPLLSALVLRLCAQLLLGVVWL